MGSAALPKATHQGSITLAGVAIRTYVLDDGRRIMDPDDVHALLNALEGGAQLNPGEAHAYAEFVAEARRS